MSPIKFNWDKGNKIKSIEKHGIDNLEAESLFDDQNKLIVLSQRQNELRFLCIGMSNKNRLLTSYYIIRNGEVRIIGTRVARKKEKESYYGR